MTVAIITDSAASLPPALAAHAGVHIVPLHLTINGDDHLDGALDLSAVVADPRGVQTSAPSPGQFLDAIQHTGPPADGILVLTIAGTMSATFKAAWTASTLTEMPVRVVDTGTAAGAEGLVVLAAAAAARQGATLEQTEARAADVIDRVRLVAAVNGLDHLVRSGRVPGIAGWAGRVLGLQPLFEFVGGGVHRLRPAQSRAGALDRIVHRWQASRPEHPARLHLSALHALAPDDAAWLEAQVCAEVEPATRFIGEFSPVMVAHTGPGLVGLAWWWEPADA